MYLYIETTHTVSPAHMFSFSVQAHDFDDLASPIYVFISTWSVVQHFRQLQCVSFLAASVFPLLVWYYHIYCLPTNKDILWRIAMWGYWFNWRLDIDACKYVYIDVRCVNTCVISSSFPDRSDFRLKDNAVLGKLKWSPEFWLRAKDPGAHTISNFDPSGYDWVGRMLQSFLSFFLKNFELTATVHQTTSKNNFTRTSEFVASNIFFKKSCPTLFTDEFMNLAHYLCFPTGVFSLR